MRPVAPAQPTVAEPSHAALEQAARWYAHLRDGTRGARDRAAWEEWLRASEEHRTAWRYVEEISHGFEPLQALTDSRAAAEVLASTNGRVHARRRLLAGLAAFAGAGMLGTLFLREELLPSGLLAWSTDHRTGKGEQREIALADGSRLWLNTASAVDVDLDTRSRRVALRRGEVFVSTASDGARPFLLRTVHAEMRALGTRFDVLLETGETRLAVFEGSVEVRTFGSGAARVLRAGQEARFDAQRIAPERSADIAREVWTQGTFVAANIPLREVVRELRRYRSGHLGLAEEVADITVYGNFPILDTDRVLHMLASVLPIRIAQPLPWWTTIEAAR